MGNMCGGLPVQKPHRRLTYSGSGRRPVTVDREAETDIFDDLPTVSQDQPTASQPPLLTLCYPPDTAAEIRCKLPTVRRFKTADQALIIGRGVDVDVMLNEEHIPRHFALVRCGWDPSMEPRWYLTNVSHKKVVSVHLNGVRTCLKYGEDAELQDGCEVNFEVLTFVIKTDNGDVGNTQGFEVEVRRMENDSSHSCSGSNTDSWNRKTSQRSTTTHTSMSSAQGRGRQGSAGANGPDPGHFVDAGPLVQHLVHYFTPGSPGSTCCLHHHPHGCPQQQQQCCHTGHQPGHVCPTLRQQSNPETGMQAVHSPLASAKATGPSYFPREETAPVASAGAGITQSSFEMAPNYPSLPGFQNTRELFPGQRPGDLGRQLMYQASEEASRHRFGMPELCGVLQNSTFMCGPSAFHHHQYHVPQSPVVAYQQPFGDDTGLQSYMQAQPIFMNLLRRSQSMFTRQKKRPEQTQRRSSCEGAQLTPQLVTQPESALMGQSVQHGFSEPDVSSTVLHDTAQKAYHTAGNGALSPCTQIDSLKLGGPAMAAASASSAAYSPTVSMFPEHVRRWEGMDGAVPTTRSARADFTSNNRCPVESISHILPSTPGFSSSDSSSGEERSWKTTAQKPLCSLKLPQENDERQAEEKYTIL